MLPLAAHLAGAADNVCDAFTAALKAFEAEAAANHSEAAVLSGTTTTNARRLLVQAFLRALGRGSVRDAHLYSSLRLVESGLGGS